MSDEAPRVSEYNLLPPVRDSRYGVIIPAERIDRDAWSLDPEAKVDLQETLGATINQFIYNAGPQGDLRLVMTLEAL